MAKTLQAVETTMALSYESGLDEKGKAIVSTQRIRNVANDVTADKLAAVGAALEKLIAFPVNGLVKETKEIIINQ